MAAPTSETHRPVRKPRTGARPARSPRPAPDLRRRPAASVDVQRLFRYANERSLALGAAHEIAFICECPRRDCVRFVSLTPAAYEQALAEPDRFVVLPGHKSLELHEVVSRGDSWVIVRPRASAPASARA
jgi:hypothetical protein